MQCKETGAPLGDSKQATVDTAMRPMVLDPLGCRLKNRHAALRAPCLQLASYGSRALPGDFAGGSAGMKKP